MMEVKVQHDTKIVIALSEEEAGKLVSLLLHADWQQEPWSEQLFDAIRDNDVPAGAVALDANYVERVGE